jgi:hypothetical protein
LFSRRNKNAIKRKLVETFGRRRRAIFCIPCKKREREITEEENKHINKEEGSLKYPMLHF